MVTNMASPNNVPIHVQQEAAAQQLGSLTRIYDFAFGYNLTRICTWLILTLICFAPVFVRAMDSIPISWGSLSATAIIVLIPLTILVISIRRTIHLYYQRIYLFQQGIIIENRGQIQTFAWSQVAEVWQRITRRSTRGATIITYHYRLQHVNGGQARLHSNTTKHIAELGQAIVQGVAQEKLPGIMHSIQAGQTVTFGDISISQQGISRNNKLLAWSQVQQVNENDEQLTIKQVGHVWNWAAVPVSRIPNARVLRLVAEEMLQVRTFQQR